MSHNLRKSKDNIEQIEAVEEEEEDIGCGCCKGYDTWYWGEVSSTVKSGHFTRSEKVMNHVNGHSIISQKFLILIRMICFAALIFRYTVMFALDPFYIEHHLTQVSMYSANMTLVYYLVLAIATPIALNRQSLKMEPSDSYSPFEWWKISTQIFQIIWTNNLMVTVLFFVLLLPTFDPAWVNLSTHLTHTVPLGVTTLDFFFNRIDFEWKHAINILVFNICYLAVMITYTVTVKPVYSIFPLTDAANFGLLSSILVAFVAVYCILALLIWFKFWIVGDLKEI